MKKAIYNKSKMRQLVDTGYKKFDNATNHISTGNIISNTQYGNFIRCWNDTRCNSTDFREGELLNFDMKHFRNVSQRIKDIIYDKNRAENVVLYEFFIGDDTIGHILCDKAHHLLASDVCSYWGDNTYWKRVGVIEEMKQYVTCKGTTKIPSDIKKSLISQIQNGNFHAFARNKSRSYSMNIAWHSSEERNEAMKRDMKPYVTIYAMKKDGSDIDYSQSKIDVVYVNWFDNMALNF